MDQFTTSLGTEKREIGKNSYSNIDNCESQPLRNRSLKKVEFSKIPEDIAGCPVGGHGEPPITGGDVRGAGALCRVPIPARLPSEVLCT